MTKSELRWQAPLQVGGAVAILAASSQLYNVLHEGDLSAPIGRFAVVRVVLPHWVPLLAGSAMVLAGAWSSGSPRLRLLLKAACLALGLVAAGSLLTILPDAASMASSIKVEQISGFRIQVLRSLLLFGASTALFLYAGFKFPSQPVAPAN